MKYIILIGDENFNLDAIKAINHYGSVNEYNISKTRYCVDYGIDHIFYDFEGKFLDGFEKPDLEKIPFVNPNFIMMIYTSEERMKSVIQQANFLREIYIDNDFGVITSIEEYISLGIPVDIV